MKVDFEAIRAREEAISHIAGLIAELNAKLRDARGYMATFPEWDRACLAQGALNARVTDIPALLALVDELRADMARIEERMQEEKRVAKLFQDSFSALNKVVETQTRALLRLEWVRSGHDTIAGRLSHTAAHRVDFDETLA